MSLHNLYEHKNSNEEEEEEDVHPFLYEKDIIQTNVLSNKEKQESVCEMLRLASFFGDDIQLSQLEDIASSSEICHLLSQADKDGCTPLHYASMEGNLHNIKVRILCIYIYIHK